jgi:hypothetical protein
MNEQTLIIGALLFVLGWYGLSQVVGRLSRKLQKWRVVWCARMKTVSFVETKPAPDDNGNNLEVGRCLLWPESHDCDQRCIRSKPFPFLRRKTEDKAP